MAAVSWRVGGDHINISRRQLIDRHTRFRYKAARQDGNVSGLYPSGGTTPEVQRTLRGGPWAGGPLQKNSKRFHQKAQGNHLFFPRAGKVPGRRKFVCIVDRCWYGSVNQNNWSISASVNDKNKFSSPRNCRTLTTKTSRSAPNLFNVT